MARRDCIIYVLLCIIAAFCTASRDAQYLRDLQKRMQPPTPNPAKVRTEPAPYYRMIPETKQYVVREDNPWRVANGPVAKDQLWRLDKMRQQASTHPGISAPGEDKGSRPLEFGISNPSPVGSRFGHFPKDLLAINHNEKDTPVATEEVVSSQESEHSLREPDLEELSPGPSDTVLSDDVEPANTSDASEAEQDKEDNPKDDTEVRSEDSVEAKCSDLVTLLKPDIETTEQIAKAEKDINSVVDSWSTEHGSPLDPEVPNSDVQGDAESLDDDLIFEEGGESIFGGDALDQLTEEAPSSQDDDKLEEDETTAFIQSSMQPNETPLENSTDAKNSEMLEVLTELRHNSETTEQVSKKELTVDSLATEPLHLQTEDKEEPEGLEEDPHHEELLQDGNAVLSYFANTQEEMDLTPEAVEAGAVPNVLPSPPALSPVHSEDTERTLEAILEASETSILDKVDSRERRHSGLEAAMFEDEAAILDDFQELAFTLRQEYSTVSDSVLVAKGQHYIFFLVMYQYTSLEVNPSSTLSVSTSELCTGVHWEVGNPAQLSPENGVLVPGEEAQVAVLLRPVEVCVYQLEVSCTFGDQGEKSCSMVLQMSINNELPSGAAQHIDQTTTFRAASELRTAAQWEVGNPVQLSSENGLLVPGQEAQVAVLSRPLEVCVYQLEVSCTFGDQGEKNCSMVLQMLLCRGKASNDFSGPDCRFLSFKKGETIYVYYKLSGQRSDVWAGSVGSRFGYFPKDLLTINHIYTEKEIEVSAEETDFVCFDSGLDKFESYDIDQLLSYSESQATIEDASVESTEIEDTPVATEEVVSSQDETPPESDQGDIVEEEGEHSLRQSDLEELSPGPSDPVLSDDVEAPDTSDASEAEQDEGENPKDDAEVHSEDSVEAKSSDLVTLLEPDIETTEQIAKAKKDINSIVDSWSAEHVHQSSETENKPKDGSPLDPEVPNPNVPGDAEPLDDDLIFEELGESNFGGDALDQLTVPPSQDDDELEEDEKTDFFQSPMQPNETTSENSTDAESSDKVAEVKRKIIEQLTKTKKVFTGAVDSRGIKHVHHPSENEAAPNDRSLVDAEVPKSDKSGDEKPLNDDLIFEEGGEPFFGEEGPFSQDDEVEEDEETGPTQSPEQPNDVPSESSGEAKSSNKMTELRYNSEVTEQIAKAKQELTGIVDSWATEPARHQSEDKITELEYDSETTEQIAKAKKELTGIVDSWATESAHVQAEGKEEPEDLEDHEELLEDENAVLSHFANTQEDGEKGDLTPEAVEAGAMPDVVLSPPALIPLEPDARTTEVPPTDESSSSVSDAENITTDESSSSTSEAENITDTTDPESSTTIPDEPEYSDSVLRLTLIRDHFKEQDMDRFQKFLSLKHLIRIEAMFQDLEQELKSARLSPTDNSEDIERTLEAILEASETSILDEIEKMLDSREHRPSDPEEMEAGMFDDEAAILDDFQELAFTLRQKYSTVSDSVPLVSKAQHEPVTEEADLHEVVEEESVNNFTVTEPDEPSDIGEVEHQHSPEPSTHGSLPHSPDLDIEEDGGHRNKDSQASPKEPDEIQRGPQAILENPLDVEFGVPWEVERPSSGSVDRHVSDFQEDGPKSETSSTSVLAEMRSTLHFFSLYWQYIGQYAEMLVATLPENWRPGPNFHGLPWEPVLATLAVGILTLIAFFWKTILAVRSRRYQITEKQLSERIKKMFHEKSETAIKMSELKKQAIEWEKRLKDSEQSQKSLLQENKELKKMMKEVNEQQKVLTEKLQTQEKTLEAERKRTQGMQGTLSKSNQTVESLQQSITSYQKELAKVQILMDESKLREDALKAEMKASEKENNKLKELKNSLQRDLKEWEAKHKDLNEKIRVFQRSQKELEDALAHKENEVDIMTDCMAELRSLEALEADDSHGDKGLANGNTTAAKRNEAMKAHIKSMMDVSRVKATLSVVEDERNRFMTKMLEEEKIRQTLEEQVQKLEHDRSELENDKSQLENQHKTLEQKLEIMSEMYQQKESALHQKLTREELDRKEKESKLSEVDKKTLKAAEEVEIHKRRIQEIEEEMEKTERFNKNLIASLEKKSHDNWLAARAAERTLTEEKRESARLRQSLQVSEEKIHEKYRSLPKPTSIHADHALRRGDSYGPSPVSGGAPSPPPMIDGPGRPPSAPVGRRGEPLGPRPPSDPHGRYADHGYAPPPRHDMYAPRTSSPTDGSQTAPAPVEAEADASTETPDAISKSQGPGSLLVSPIRDSPGPIMPPKGHGPPLPGGRHPMGPAPPNGLPPMMRPNGHPPMKSPGPMAHDPRFGPPLPDQHFGPPGYGPRPGPMPGPGYGPPPFMRGPTPPMRDYPPMGPAYGPDYPYPPRHPSSAAMLPPPGAMLPPPGAMPPPGVMLHPGMMPPPPPHGERDFRGPPPPLGYSQGDSRLDNSAKTDNSSQQAPPAQQDSASMVLDP